MKSSLAFRFLIAALSAATLLPAEETTPYISPGIGISWNMGKYFTLGTKISVGVAGYAPGFYNLTVGGKWRIFKTYESQESSLYYADLQTGCFLEVFRDNTDNIFGGGLGIAYFHDRILPHATLFTGYLLFLNADFTYDHQIHADVGIQGVLPIPLKGDAFEIGVDPNPGH